MTNKELTRELARLRRRVAELEHLEESCRSSETTLREMYKKVVEDLPDLICRYKPDTTITFVNEAYAKYFGKSADELVGTSFLKLIPDEHHDYVRGKVASLNEEAPVASLEHKVLTPDGQIKWHLWRDRALFDCAGNITEVQAIGQDITDRKHAEEVLRAAKANAEDEKAITEAILESMGEAVSIHGRDFRVLYQNHAHKNIIGDHLGEYCYKGYKGKDSVCEGCPLALAYEDGEIHAAEQSSNTQGSLRHVDITASPLRDSTGEIIGGIEIVKDITSRKETEENTRGYQEHLQDMVRERTVELTAAIELLQEQISEGRRSENFIKNILKSLDERLIVLTRDYRIISANRSFCDSVGMTQEEVNGKHCYELMHGRQTPCYEAGEDCSAKRAFTTGQPFASTHTHDNNGDSIFVETKTYPMRDDGGNITSVIQIINDVTEKRKLEEQLRHSQKMEAVGQLAGGVAHDFNNRLAAIINYAFILKTKLREDDPLRVHVNQILNSSERAAHLTQNLLTFSRKHVINPKPVKLNDVVDGIQKLLVRVIGEDIELKTEFSKEDLVVMADSGQIEHVLINLATNARDAMPGAGRVAIATSRVVLGPEFFEGRSSSRPGQYALISFMDSGSGMPSETKSKIFEPFFTTKGVGKGTGLGLSIVYGIVKQHGGYIRVESEPGLGTAFYIFLPLLAARAEQAETEHAVYPAGGGETVLLVEDDEDVRRPVRQMLEGFGYEVIEATNGEDAIEKFLQSRKTVRLLVLDVMLPGINGPDVLSEIRKVEPNMKAIFTSGYSKEHALNRGLPLLGTSFLPKPVAPELLLVKVREALDE